MGNFIAPFYQITEDMKSLYGNLPKQEEDRITYSNKLGELQKWTANSIINVLKELNIIFKFNDKDFDTFKDVMLDKKEYDENAEKLFKKAQEAFVSYKEKDCGESEEGIILDILAMFHNELIEYKVERKEFNKLSPEFFPIELIGWEEVEKEWTVIKPIIESIGVNINERDLKEEYDMQVINTLKDKKIFNDTQLAGTIFNGFSNFGCYKMPEKIKDEITNKENLDRGFIYRNIIPEIKKVFGKAEKLLHQIRRYCGGYDLSLSESTQTANKPDYRDR